MNKKRLFGILLLALGFILYLVSEQPIALLFSALLVATSIPLLITKNKRSPEKQDEQKAQT